MDLTVLGTGVTLRLLAVEFHADPGDGGKRCRAGAGGVHRNVERLRRDGFGGVGAVRIVLMQQLRLAERERAETGQAGQPGKVDGERVWGVGVAVDGKQQTTTKYFCVPESTYLLYDIGDYFNSHSFEIE